MGTTANRAYPYPESTDSPAGHTQIEALANAVDADVAGLPILQAKKSIIATEQSRNSTDWGYLGTNDKVTIDVPANGLVGVAFTAKWKESVQGAAKAAIFLGGTEQFRLAGSGAPAFQSALLGGTVDTYQALVSAPFGLFSIDSNASVGTYGVDVNMAVAQYAATAQMDLNGTPVDISGVHGGPCYIRWGETGGSTEFGVKFYRSSGTVTVAERALLVWTMAFD